MKYRKKPAVIDAIEWIGSNADEVVEFMKSSYSSIFDDNQNLTIHTLEGDMKANVGDFIIRGVDGEYYPCKPEIFNKTYERCD